MKREGRQASLQLISQNKIQSDRLKAEIERENMYFLILDHLERLNFSWLSLNSINSTSLDKQTADGRAVFVCQILTSMAQTPGMCLTVAVIILELGSHPSNYRKLH